MTVHDTTVKGYDAAPAPRECAKVDRPVAIGVADYLASGSPRHFRCVTGGIVLLGAVLIRAMGG